MNANTAAILAIGAGACIALQAAANTRLKFALGVPGIWASYCSILGTVFISSIAMLILRPTTPAMANIRQTDWTCWIGGPLGALIVLAGTMLVQHLGAALFIAFVVAGQLTASLVLDHFAMMGLNEQPITWTKAGGAMLIVIGVVVMKYL
jgi:bacterial/archaeal transporter family-2 protein